MGGQIRKGGYGARLRSLTGAITLFLVVVRRVTIFFSLFLIGFYHNMF